MRAMWFLIQAYPVYQINCFLLNRKFPNGIQAPLINTGKELLVSLLVLAKKIQIIWVKLFLKVFFKKKKKRKQNSCNFKSVLKDET